jgi:glutamate/aspartate transport system substrate-binding protein
MVPRLVLVLAAILFTLGGASGESLDGRLESIKNTGIIRISFRPDANPFSFLDERGEHNGYTIEICKLVVKSIQEQLGVALVINWIPVDTTTRFDTVAKDMADMECGSSTVTLTRMVEVDFSSFIFVESTGLAVKANSGIRSLNDMAGKKIAVLVGTTNERALRDQFRQRQLETTLVLVKSRAEGIARLEEGSVDGFASDKLLLFGALLEKRPGLTVLADDLSFEPYAITLPRGDWAFRLAVNRALAQIYRTGEILHIFDRWFGPFVMRPTLLLDAAYIFGQIPD